MTFNISKFVSEIQTRGVMRNNRFEATFVRPPLTVIKDLVPNKLRCESVQFPGLSFADIPFPRMGTGPIESMPFGVTFDDITLTFIVDARGDVHKFFYLWFSSIINFNAKGQTELKKVRNRLGGYEVGYKDDYMSNIEITVFDTKNSPDGAGVKVMKATIYRAYPKLLPTLDLAWGSNDEVVKLSIPFTYTDFNIVYYNADTGPRKKPIYIPDPR